MGVSRNKFVYAVAEFEYPFQLLDFLVALFVRHAVNVAHKRKILHTRHFCEHRVIVGDERKIALGIHGIFRHVVTRHGYRAGS